MTTRTPTSTPPRASGTPASRVLELVRSRGSTKREELVRLTGLSPATVARAASALVDAGVLRYARHNNPERGVGRPGIPVEIDPRSYAVVGVHLGRRAATVALADLSGHVLAAQALPHRSLDLPTVADVAGELLIAHADRQPLSAGVAAPWRELGWDRIAITNELHDALGLDVESAEHLSAMADAEFLLHRPTAGSTIFLYVRDTAGFVVVDHDGERPVVSPPWSLDHFPTGSPVECACGRTGCLIATVGDQAIAQAAHAKGWVPQARVSLVSRAAELGHPGARNLVRTRARTLATLVDHVGRMAAPDRIVLAGQAFTADPAVQRLAELASAAELTTTRFGSEIQAYAACATALRLVDRDPLGVVPRVRAVS